MAPKSKSNSSNASHKNAPAPYRWALLDKVIIVSFALFFLLGCLVDCINGFAPVGGVTEADAKNWPWPPQFMFPIYFWWCRTCDPILELNPLWIKYLSLLSPVVFCPFYLIAIYAILNKQSWIRIPCVIYASVLFVDLSAFYVESMWGELPSPNPLLFTVGYGYYQFFPLLLLYRFWADDPFDQQQQSSRIKAQ